jgi:phosphoribosyl 1,2-cyclic phosphodiesterase
MELGFGPEALRLVVLGSGSSGNAVVLEAGGQRLLIDAGFSCKEIERRLERVGLAGASFSGLVITHEHGDHCRGARVFARRHRVPVFATAGTFARLRLGEGGLFERVVLRSGVPRQIGSFRIEPFEVPHDAAEPIGLLVQDAGGHRVGVLADLGARTHLAWGRLTDLDALLLETNHDLEMLRNGPYPWPLKERIAARHGHLSNREAAEGLPDLLNDRLKFVVLYHLSRTNNLPVLAEDAIGERLAREGSAARMQLTTQADPTPWFGMRGGESWVEALASPVDSAAPSTEPVGEALASSRP